MNNKLKKFFTLFLLIIYFFSFSHTKIFAAINKSYLYNENMDFSYDKEEVVKSSPITNYIGAFIYTIAERIEAITTSVLTLAMGGNSFPWSDRIIFNTIPILDVNFINPDERSLLSNPDKNGIGKVVRNTYFSTLTIALGFLGIIVAVMAIKLAISTIASDKAKYKEAIVKWLTALVLLFGMHFVLAFLFFLNERLVETASSMLSKTTLEASKKIEDILNSTLNNKKDEIIDNYIKLAETDKTFSLGNIVRQLANVGLTVVCPPAGVTAFAGSALTAAGNEIIKQQIKDEFNDPKNRDLIFALSQNSVIREKVIPHVSGNSDSDWVDGLVSGIADFTGADLQRVELQSFITYVSSINGMTEKDIDKGLKNLNKGLDIDGKTELDDDTKAVMTEVYNLALRYKRGEDITSTTVGGSNIISSLGEFFKYKAWYIDVDNGGWSPSSVSIVSAILYALLVFQSISFFIAYIRRFFIVIILSIMAPLVVIYDFFNKSMSI